MRVASALHIRWIVLSMFLLGATLTATPSASASTTLTLIRGSILSFAATNHEGYGGDVAYGTPMKFPTMSIGVPNPDPVSCLGERCFALGITGGFQYPAISSDHGRTWRNGGHWFAGAWADAAAFANRVTILSATVAIAWVPMQATGFYSTSTAGRRWCAVVWPGNVTSVHASRGGDVMTVTVVARNSGNTLRYSSRDGGLVWRLDH
jgi:hypothetical protein